MEHRVHSFMVAHNDMVRWLENLHGDINKHSPAILGRLVDDLISVTKVFFGKPEVTDVVGANPYDILEGQKLFGLKLQSEVRDQLIDHINVLEIQ